MKRFLNALFILGMVSATAACTNNNPGAGLKNPPTVLTAPGSNGAQLDPSDNRSIYQALVMSDGFAAAFKDKGGDPTQNCVQFTKITSKGEPDALLIELSNVACPSGGALVPDSSVLQRIPVVADGSSGNFQIQMDASTTMVGQIIQGSGSGYALNGLCDIVPDGENADGESDLWTQYCSVGIDGSGKFASPIPVEF